MDIKEDGVMGVSVDKSYRELLRNRKSNPVIVAVIDTGIDTAHNDLKSVLWYNEKEIPGNGIDDDSNGYIDDVHGWNFITSAFKGFSDKEDIARIIEKEKPFYDSILALSGDVDRVSGYGGYRKKLRVYYEFCDLVKRCFSRISSMQDMLDEIADTLDKQVVTLESIKEQYKTNDSNKRVLFDSILATMKSGLSFERIKNETDSLFILLDRQIRYGLNITKPVDITTSVLPYKGNNDILERSFRPSFDAYHGTHVAGIIAAVRNNFIGINGVADNVLIMPIKINSLFNEPGDRNLAKAIRYAVDNGASIINMSFGKGYSYDKEVVDEAVKYAMKHDVLIVHAAMNNGQDLDRVSHYPNKYYLDGGIADAWIEVGASRWKDDSLLISEFSNYGHQVVDCFAPGDHVFSTIPEGRYGYDNGTSMAAPVVTGIAAVIREYCPGITARQVKDIIVNSVTRIHHNVVVRDIAGEKQVIPFANTCISGGIVNMYKALSLAFSIN